MVKNILTIDLETMGLDPMTAPILEVGYCIGNRESKGILCKESFLVPNAWNTTMRRVPSMDTIAWWIEKACEREELKDHALKLLDPSGSSPKLLKLGLDTLSERVKTFNVEEVWVTDKSFDWVMFSVLANSMQVDPYFGKLIYKDIYDARYFLSHYPDKQKDAKKEAVTHTAKDDAAWLFEFIADLTASEIIL